MPEVEAHSSDLLHLRSSVGQFGVDASRLVDDVLRSADANIRRAADSERKAKRELRAAEERLRATLRQKDGPGKDSLVVEERRHVDLARRRADVVTRSRRRVEDAAKAVQLAARTFRQETSRQVPEAEAMLMQLAEDALLYERVR